MQVHPWGRDTAPHALKYDSTCARNSRIGAFLKDGIPNPAIVGHPVCPIALAGYGG